MQKLLITMCLSVATGVFAMDYASADSRGGVSVGGVSAGRDGVSVGGVSAGRGGASARSGGATATASRDGASVGGSSVSSHDDGSRGFVNARGDREYDDLGSWMEDLGSWWSGNEPPAERTVGSESTSSSSSEQVSKARATSSNGEPAVAEASNRKVTGQN